MAHDFMLPLERRYKYRRGLGEGPLNAASGNRP